MELLERERYLTDLTQWLHAVEEGGCIVLVDGEAGIGKTSLLQAFSNQQRETRVLWGACDALFTPRPLAPLHDIARQTQSALLAAVNSATNRNDIFNACLDELEHGEQALVVFEDMHWADEATLDLLKFLGRRIARTRAMLMVSYRDDEVGSRHPLRSVIGDLPRASTRRVSVAPLSETAVAELARRAGRSAKGLHSVTGGNPLFVTEVLAAKADTVPVTVRDAVLARTSRLSPAARKIAELVCVVPGKADAWLVEQAPSDDATIEHCLNIGMLRGEDGSLAFRHELTRRAVEESLPLPVRRQLHAVILRAMLERPGSNISAARLIHHADGAADSEAVLRHAPVAAEQAAAVGAHREAAAHYATALRHAGTLSDEGRAELLDRLSYESYLIDQLAEAIAAREAALRLWQKVGNRTKEGDDLRWLARLHWFNGQSDVAQRHATQAIEVLEPLPHGRELAMAYSCLAQLHMLTYAKEPALLFGGKALALALQIGDQEIEIHALNNIGSAKLNSGDEAGRVDLERSLSLALTGHFEEHAARAYTNLSYQAVITRDYARAVDYVARGIAHSDEHDLDLFARYMRAIRAQVCLAHGDWDQAVELTEAILCKTDLAPLNKIAASTVLGVVRVRRGDPGVQPLLDAARDLAMPTGEIQRIGPVCAARAEAAWTKGDRAAVIAEASAGYEVAVSQGDVWAHGQLAYWLWRAGELTHAPARIAVPFALQIAGDWQAAAAAWEKLGCPYEQAMALADSADERALREAFAIFERLGAVPMATHLRHTLRARGVRGIPRGPNEATRANPAGLTSKEIEILTLLAHGSSNAQLASQLHRSTKTIDHHVSAILEKLDVHSRTQAVAAAFELGIISRPSDSAAYPSS